MTYSAYGLAAWAVIVTASAGAGCGQSLVEPSAGTGGGGAGSTSGAIGSTSGATSSTSSSSGNESSTGEPQFEGPGCGAPPVCDRGVFEGHARIESEADLAQVAGFTEITGSLEIMNSQDLVCLDALACLEVVGRDVRVQDNAALRSTEGLSALREIGQEGGWRGSGQIIVANNAVLERLAGFSVPEAHRSVLILENPQLRTVSGFRSLQIAQGLHVTSNPRLDSLVGLRDVVDLRLCYVSFNERLCADEIVAVCGGLEHPPHGAAVENASVCGSVPGGTFEEWEPSEGFECSILADACPPGHKCMPVSPEGYWNPTQLACRPIIDEPDQPYEDCSVLGEQGSGLDTCGRHAYCRNDECVPMCRDYAAAGGCLSTEAHCKANSTGTLLLCEHACDPVLQNCDAGEGCYPIDWAFQCFPVASEPGAGSSGQDCDFINSCDAGLTCVNPDVRSDCSEDAGGCCSEICDVTAQDCPAGLECAAWYELPFPAHLPLHLENVGICADPI